MNKLKDPVSEGWIVQVYGQNRRLICALEPSHGWTFLAGLILGTVATLIIYNLNPTPRQPKAESSLNTNVTAPLMLD